MSRSKHVINVVLSLSGGYNQCLRLWDSSYCKIMEDKSRNQLTVAGLARDRLDVSALLLDQLEAEKIADYHQGFIPYNSREFLKGFISL